MDRDKERVAPLKTPSPTSCASPHLGDKNGGRPRGHVESRADSPNWLAVFPRVFQPTAEHRACFSESWRPAAYKVKRARGLPWATKAPPIPESRRNSPPFYSYLFFFPYTAGRLSLPGFARYTPISFFARSAGLISFQNEFHPDAACRTARIDI